jgi:hypothetical protein
LALVELLCVVKTQNKEKKMREENQGGKVRENFDDEENVVFV